MPIDHNALTIESIRNLDRRKIVVIVGAGPAGLVSALYALRNGLCPVVLESSNAIGGIWRDGTWDSMQTNLSKFSLFSDLLCRDDMPMFPSAANMREYLKEYAEKFDLYQYIIFNAKVTNVQLTSDVLKQVDVTIDGKQTTLFADNVIIASGYFNKPNMPAIPGMAQLENAIVHSSQYKTARFTNEDVVIVGNGFSAVDIATEAAKSAKSVTHVIEKPFWILPRYMSASTDLGTAIPLDLYMASYSRALRKSADEVTIRTKADYQKANAYLSSLCRAQTAKDNPLHIDPNSNNPPFVAISDSYMDQILQKKIKIQYGNVASFTKNAVLIGDNKLTLPASKVIFCTGYNNQIPFLAPNILRTLDFKENDRLQSAILYEGTLHPDLPGIAFVGMYRGPYFTTMELMARLACGIFAGTIHLSDSEMRAGLNKATQIREQTPRPQFPHGDFVGFADGLAKAIGCGFDLNKLKETKPNLHEILKHKPVTAADYRLFGPHADPNIFLQQYEDMQATIRTSQPKHPMFVKSSPFLSPAQSGVRTLATIAKKILTKGPKF